jgi:hypothetical protein
MVGYVVRKRESVMDYQTAQQIFGSLAGGTFVGIDTQTEVKLKGGKKNPHQGRVTKVMRGAQIMVFTNSETNAYDAMVRRRLEAEGKDPDSFKLGERAWGVRIAGTPFVEHKGEYYLETIFMRAGSVEYQLDGVSIDKADIEGLEERGVNPDSQAGLENRVVIRTFKLDSIMGLRAMGVDWS